MNTRRGCGDQIARDLQALAACRRKRSRADRRCGRRRSPPAPASRARRRGCGRNGGRPCAISRSPILPPAETFMRRPARGVLVDEAPVGAHQRPPLRFRQRRQRRAPRRRACGRRPRRHRPQARRRRRLSSVVLPEPDSPTIASTSPCLEIERNVAAGAGSRRSACKGLARRAAASVIPRRPCVVRRRRRFSQ